MTARNTLDDVVSFIKSKIPFIQIRAENCIVDENLDSPVLSVQSSAPLGMEEMLTASQNHTPPSTTTVLRISMNSESSNSDHGLDPLTPFKKDEYEIS